MLVTKAIVVPSGDHAVPTRLRVMNSFSTESLCTSALDLLVICSGSVIAAGVASCWARVRVLMNMNITKLRLIRMLDSFSELRLVRLSFRAQRGIPMTPVRPCCYRGPLLHLFDLQLTSPPYGSPPLTRSCRQRGRYFPADNRRTWAGAPGTACGRAR